MDVRRNKKNDWLCEERNAILNRLPLGKTYEKERDQWLNKDHRIYYKRKGRKVTFSCTNKESEQEYYINSASLEESTRTYTGEIRHNLTTTCPICGKKGLMVAEGLRRKRDIMRKYFAVYQMAQKNLLTIRIVEVEKEYGLGEFMEIRKPKREGWETETIRIYLYADHRVYKDFHKQGWEGEFWDYKNISGMGNIETPIVYEEIGKEVVRDADWLKYMDFDGRAFRNIENIRRYMAATEFPIIEILQKRGANEIAEELAYGSCVGLNRKAKKPEEFFGITKDRLRTMVKKNQGVSYLRVYQEEKKSGMAMPEGLVEYLAGQWERPDPEIWEYTTPQKYWNYVKKQIESEKKARENGRYWEYSVIGLHNDYLQAVKDLELPLTNPIYLFPRDLKEKHDEFVRRRNLQQDQKRIEKKNEEYPKIAERYTRLLKKYGYEKEELFIRPAGSAGEIIEEGRMLHHCVGGDNYLSKHDKGESYILFLRRKKEPETPWCTIEIKGSNIIQWYEMFDRKPDQDLIDPFLEEYTKQLGKKKRAAG